MRKILVILSVSAASLLAISCVKDTTITQNYSSKRYFDSWIKTNFPDAERSELGTYILEDTSGTGAAVGDESASPYLFLNYVTRNLDGEITNYTDSSTAKQMHAFDRTAYYGPKVVFRPNNGLSAGIEDILKDMKIGGKRKVAVPGWLASKTRYRDEQEYLDKVTGDPFIMDIEVVDATQDMIKYQIDSIERYMDRNYHKVDSSKWGFYYIQTQPPVDETKFKAGDLISINYTGRLLNNLVFDTSIKDSAKVHHLPLNGEYGTTYFKYADEYSEYSLNGGSEGNLIDGFAYCLSLMGNGEKGIAVFTSVYGYGTDETEAIPAYSPLRFDLEVVGLKK